MRVLRLCKIAIEIARESLYSISIAPGNSTFHREAFYSSSHVILYVQPDLHYKRAAMPLLVHHDLCTREENMAALSDLTPRELEILQFVLAGQTNKTIAAHICISEKTVEFHLANIYAKLGVRTRMLAGLWAMQQGIGAKTREIPR